MTTTPSHLACCPHCAMELSFDIPLEGVAAECPGCQRTSTFTTTPAATRHKGHCLQCYCEFEFDHSVLNQSVFCPHCGEITRAVLVSNGAPAIWSFVLQVTALAMGVGGVFLLFTDAFLLGCLGVAGFFGLGWLSNEVARSSD